MRKISMILTQRKVDKRIVPESGIVPICAWTIFP